MTNELLFECYRVPSVCFGIDSAFSFLQNSSCDSGIVISSSHFRTHVVPIIRGKVMADHAKRINFGGSQAANFFQKLLVMKYPTFPSRVTSSQAHRILNRTGYISMDYLAELREYEENVAAALEKHDVVVQFPYIVADVVEQTAEDRENKKQRQLANAQRLRDQAAKKRDDKLKENESLRTELLDLTRKRQDPDQRSGTSVRFSLTRLILKIGTYGHPWTSQR